MAKRTYAIPLAVLGGLVTMALGCVTAEDADAEIAAITHTPPRERPPVDNDTTDAAADDEGEGGASRPSEDTGTESPLAIPSDLVVTRTEVPGALFVSWTPLAEAAIRYEVSLAAADVDPEVENELPFQLQIVEGTDFTFTDLTHGKRYFARIRAHSATQASDWSGSESAVSHLAAPSRPAMAVSFPGTRNGSERGWLEPVSGTYYCARGVASGASCPAGTTRQFRLRGRYFQGSYNQAFKPWTEWASFDDAYMIRPIENNGTEFQAVARCVGADATSAESELGSGRASR